MHEVREAIKSACLSLPDNFRTKDLHKALESSDVYRGIALFSRGSRIHGELTRLVKSGWLKRTKWNPGISARYEYSVRKYDEAELPQRT